VSGTWYDSAVAAIDRAVKDLPADTSLEERTKVVDAAYPFGERAMFPYKSWLRARRHYLARYGYRKRGLPLSPLERLMQKAGQS
jgi:hypothetical protein